EGECSGEMVPWTLRGEGYECFAVSEGTVDLPGAAVDDRAPQVGHEQGGLVAGVVGNRAGTGLDLPRDVGMVAAPAFRKVLGVAAALSESGGAGEPREDC